jgi:tyrosyl-tRNA synthetase
MSETLAPDHALTCAALKNWRDACDCGVGIETVSLSITSLQVTRVAMSSLLVELGLVDSKSAAARLIKAGAVEIIDDSNRRTATLQEWLPQRFILRSGRQWRRVSLV